jgi:hypothetical protein
MCYIDGQKDKYSVLNECNRMREHNWLRHYAKIWKAAGSIPDEVTGFSFPN